MSLATCFFNHVKYVAVAAESVPPFPEPVWGEDVLRGLRGERIWGVVGAGARSAAAGGGGVGGEEHDRLKIGQLVNPNMRERRFGILRRMIQVPAYTTVSFAFRYFIYIYFSEYQVAWRLSPFFSNSHDITNDNDICFFLSFLSFLLYRAPQKTFFANANAMPQKYDPLNTD